MSSSLREANSLDWDRRTKVHVQSRFYDVEAFRAGACTLKPPERRLVGDVSGRRLLHLQCHFGLDTMSWGRLGAEATGVDFSAEAVAYARKLSADVDVKAEFEQCDVQQIGDRFKASFDVVVTSYGVLCWLDDLDEWAFGIFNSLKSGGRFVLVEFHPVLDVVQNGILSGSQDYFRADVVSLKTTGTYASPDAAIECTAHRWQHPLGEVVTALISAGLRIETLEEFPYCAYRVLGGLDVEKNGMWVPSKDPNRLPYMYAVAASKP